METIHEVWSGVLEYLHSLNDISEVAYKVWLSQIEPVSIEEDAIVVSVHTDFQRKIIREHYASRLKDAFMKVLGLPLDLKILCEQDQAAAAVASADSLALPDPVGEDEEFTFGNFVVGSSNKFAHAASLAVASNPSGNYNPLFIYGNSGLGKTHLMLAIRNEIRKNHPEYKMVYTKGETMTNELIDALQVGSTAMQDFRSKFRQIDVLLVDDIQFIAGKERTQEEFFHTFDALYQAKKQIILTSDRPPREMASLEDRLRSRFESGLLADIQPPDLETRIVIIRRKAQQLGLPINDNDIEYIADQLKSNIRQLEGLVKKLRALYQIEHEMPSRIAIQSAICDIRNNDQPAPLTVERVLTEVARTYNVKVEDLRSTNRSGQISQARMIAAYVVYSMTSQSMATIGEEIGNRDHSTIVYYIQKVKDKMEIDSSYKRRIQDIIKNLTEK